MGKVWARAHQAVGMEWQGVPRRRGVTMAELTPDRLDELHRIAEVATPGPYEVVGLAGYGGPYALRMPHRSGRTWYGVEGIKRREDAEYIATFDPPKVLALLDEIERLRREREILAEAVMGWQRYLERDVGTEIVHIRTLEAHGG